MYRLIRMSGKWYAVKFEELSDESENIVEFVDQGDCVVLADDLETFSHEFDVDIDSIEVVHQY